MERALGSLRGTTLLSRALAGWLVLVFVVAAAAPQRTVGALALTPGSALPYFYTLMTAGVLEDSLLGLVAGVAVLLSASRVLEPAFGTVGYLRFLSAINLGNGVVLFLAHTAAYAATANPEHLYVQLRGFSGTVAALLVALKAVVPRLPLPNEARPLVTVAALPALTVAMAVTLAAMGIMPRHRALGWVAGAANAWLWLRFVQPQLSSTPLGDEDQLTLASFLQPPAASAGSTGAPGAGGTAAPQLSRTAIDASRKRERGLRALEERLAAAEAMEADAAQAGSSSVGTGVGAGAPPDGEATASAV